MIEARDRVQPTFKIPSGLMKNHQNGDGAKPDNKGGVRAMTPEVDLTGIEPVTSCLPSKRSTI